MPLLPRGIHLDFPHFNRSNPVAWVFKATWYFEFHQTAPNQRLLMASYHLEDVALIWYKDAVDGRQFSGWDSFVKALLLRFGPTAYDNLMESLTRLKHTSSVVASKTQFESLSNRLKGFFEKHKLSCFLSDLKGEIRLPIKMLNPINLSATFGLAKTQEKNILSLRKAFITGAFGGDAQTSGSGDRF